MKRSLLFFALLLLQSCTTVPDGIKPVENFKLQRYLGVWYEIARLDHSFERGLNNVSAEYSLLEDGGVKVINRGFNSETQEWEQASGKAYFVTDEDIGHLKVSFFGPFYSSYVIFELDAQDYQYAMVTGPDREYFWLLSRDKSLPDKKRQELIQMAREKGFAVEKLIFVDHE